MAELNPSNSISVGSMSGSAIQQASAGASQHVSMTTTDVSAVLEVIGNVASSLSQLSLDAMKHAELQAQIDIIRVELQRPVPTNSIVRDCLQSIRGSLENVAVRAMATSAGMAAATLVQQIQNIL